MWSSCAFCFIKKQGKEFQSQKEKQQQIEWKEAVYHQLMTAETRLFSCPTMLSQQRPRAEPVWDASVPGAVLGAGWSPTCSHKYLCQTILENRAEGNTSLWLLQEPFCGNSLCRANLCFLGEDSLPLETENLFLSWVSNPDLHSFLAWSCLALSFWFDPSQEQDAAASFRCKPGSGSLPFPFPHHLGDGIFHLLLK